MQLQIVKAILVTSLAVITLIVFAAPQVLAAPDGMVKPDTDTCVHARSVKHVEVLNEDLVLMHGAAERVWLNRLGRSCRGLRQNMVIQLDLHSTQLCANDRFRASHRSDDLAGFRQCQLGNFEMLNQAQVATLRQSIAAG